MKALIIKNTPIEGPGTIAEFLSNHSIDYKIVEASLGEKIPPPDEYRFLIVMGGPMAVYEMNKYPFLKDVSRAMEEALKKGIRILGVCLGAQLLAHTLGSRVYPGNVKEIGWLDVKATTDGMSDGIFRTIVEPSGAATVIQWHGDTYDLPYGATRLAYSEYFPEQAFRYENSYALQFHIEVTPQMIREWFNEREDAEIIMKQTESLYPKYRSRAELFYSKFFI